MKRQLKNISLKTRITEEQLRILHQVCERAGISSPYMLMQILVTWLCDICKDGQPIKESEDDCSYRAEIEEMFEGLATADKKPFGKEYILDSHKIL